MKKLLALSAALVLGMFVVACDFGEPAEEDGTVTPNEETTEQEPDGTELPPEDVLEGTCTVGQTAGYTLVRIEDDLNNKTLDPTDCGSGNPGADIDAVCLYDADDNEKGCAISFEVEDWPQATCENDKADASLVLGPPDGCSQDGCFEGYFSLNGGAVIVEIGPEGGEPVELVCGDSLTVWEMYNPDKVGSDENFEVSYGVKDGPWTDPSFIKQADQGTGEINVEVSWEW